MDKQIRNYLIIIITLSVIIIYLLVGGKNPLAKAGTNSASSGSSNTGVPGTNGIDGTCSDGGKYHCYITCTDTPPTTTTRTYSCCSGGFTHLSNSCYSGSCPSGYSLINTFNSQNECQSNCGTPIPTTPTDGTTCRNYATDNGYSASAWQLDITSITSCQSYVLGHACSVPIKIDIAGNCCMWTC